MSQSYMVECPSCHARGELSDPTLLGKAISCPACQFVFTLPMPDVPSQASPISINEPTPVLPAIANPATPISAVQVHVPATEAPVAVATVIAVPPIISEPIPIAQIPPTPLPTMNSVPVPVAMDPGPSVEIAPQLAANQVVPAIPVVAIPQGIAPQPFIPPQATVAPQPQEMMFGQVSSPPPDASAFNFAGTTPSAAPSVAPQFPGIAEVQFAQSLPQPSALGSVKPKKEMSKQMTMLVGGGVAAVILFFIVMFLLGDPSRQASKKYDENVAAAEKAKKEKKRVKRTASDTSLSDKLKEIQQRMSAPDSSPKSTPGK